MAMTRSLSESRCHRGFSLIELSIVLIVFALLAGSLLPLASGQRQQQEEMMRKKAELNEKKNNLGK